VSAEKLDEAAKALALLLEGLKKSPHGPEAIRRLIASNPQGLPSLNGMLGLAVIKEALEYWRQNQTSGDELFWKRAFKERAYVLSQAFVYPVIIIDDEAYIGGKQLNNKGGSLVDFLAKVESTGQAVLIEIKTPKTPLLGRKYRNDVYPFSDDLAGGVAQALKYRQRFISHSHDLLRQNRNSLIIGAPRCLLIAGNARREFATDSTDTMRDDFELLREQSDGVTIITYDELFQKLERIVSLLEGRDS
jgi:hypothetical protein